MTSTPPRSPPRRPWAVRLHGLLAAGVAWVVVFASVQAALAIPAEERLSAPEVAALLDYSGLPGTVSPLSEEYIAQALGLPPPEEPSSDTVVQEEQAANGTPTLAGDAPAPDEELASGRTRATHAATNDDIADAYRVPSVPFTATTNASDASRESDEPGSCAPVGPTLWYRYTPSEDGVLIANTAGSDGLMALAVFAGAPIDDAQQGCHTNPLGYAEIPFLVDAGTTYYFQVTALLQLPVPAGAQRVVFNLDPFGHAELVSVTSDGEQRYSTLGGTPAMSADGRFVAFRTDGPYVADDDNSTADIYVHDRDTGRTERASVASDGTGGNDKSGARRLDISADGRYVAFHSWASNLVEGDTNDWQDVFVHDRRTGVTERVSVASDGTEGRKVRDPQAAALSEVMQIWGSMDVALSADGRFVVFESTLTGLTPSTSGTFVDHKTLQVYLHDRRTGETTLVSRTPDGEPGGGFSDFPDISADGRYIVYRSRADDISGGRPETYDVFVHDRREDTTRLVSVDSDGTPGDDSSGPPEISGDGRHVAFQSHATNLVDGDTNQSLDVFVHDLATRTTTRESVTTSGEQAPLHVESTIAGGGAVAGFAQVAISDGGRFVVFDHDSPTFVRGHEDEDGADNLQVYVRDRLARTTTLVSVSPTGELGNRDSWLPAITPDGRHIAFESEANNLVAGDRNSRCCFRVAGHGNGEWGTDIFVHTFPVLR